MDSCGYYLERVGFEANVKLRLNLKNGKNVIGRIKDEFNDVDFPTNSMRCSGRHCIITVSGDSVQIENLSRTVGTTINNVKMNEQVEILRENDVIGIVRPWKVPWNSLGDYNLFMYRLRKYSSDNLLTIEIDDDDTLEVSDDDDLIADDDIIILDPIDIKVEHDLGIQLSRNFNAEIKQEIMDLDDFESFCKEIKKEPSNFFDIETNDDDVLHDLNDIVATFNPHLAANDESNPEACQSTSNDSSNTTIFSPTHHRNIEFDSDSKTNSSPNSNVVDMDMSLDTDDGHKVVSNETSQNEVVLDDKLEKTVTKIKEKVKNLKKNAELTKPKPMEKRHKKSDNKKESVSKKAPKPKTEKLKSVKEDKSKRVTRASTSKQSSETKEKCETKEKTKTTAKVKYTKDNRGTFLTDPKQIPGKPASVKERRKSTLIAPPSVPPRRKSVTSERVETINKEIDELLSTLEPAIADTTSAYDPTYSNYTVRKLSFADLRKPENIEAAGSPKSSPTNRNASDQPDYNGNSPRTKLRKMSFSDAYIRQDSGVAIDNHNSPNARTEDVGMRHKAAVKDARIEDVGMRHKAAVKDSGFQINPCHEIISIITSYDAEQYRTVDAFCRSIDLNMEAFGDTFKDYGEYRGTLLPLLMAELWMEIEMEYTNSQIHNFATVKVTDKNIEKRGDGRRMVFHCQAESPIKSHNISDGHLLYVVWMEIEFLAVVTHISYIRKSETTRFAHFTMETSALTEELPIDSLQIRPITVISNTLNAFRSIYNLYTSPLLNLVLNPLTAHQFQRSRNVIYKGYDKLDTEQSAILKSIYEQCVNLNVPTISLLDGAAGTGKSCMISNLALQLVYGDTLPRPLRVLICARSNKNIDEIAKKLLHVRDRTCNSQKIQLVRFGILEQMDKAVRCVSVQHLKANEQRFLQLANVDRLKKEKKTLELKIRALSLDDENDNAAEMKVWKTKLIKVDTLLGRLTVLDENKIKDSTTILLNACDIICTTLANIIKLQNFIPSVDVCIMDEATQCNESLTLLPFRFGMSSLVLVGDSQLPPPQVYSPIAAEKNYGKSLFSRFQKLFAGKTGAPIYRINIQHRMHPEIMKWPNHYFYSNTLRPDASKVVDNFPIVPYKIISYSPAETEPSGIMAIMDVLLDQIDSKKNSIGIISPYIKQKTAMQVQLKNYPYISTYVADESHLNEKDVIVIWINKEYGMGNLCSSRGYSTLLNRAVTRAKRCLLICGIDLMSYKSRPIWKALIDDAQQRNCFHHVKLTQPKILNILKKKSVNE